MKKRPVTIFLVMILIVMCSVLSGCGEKDTAEKPTTIMQIETTPAATPTPTPTSTPTPTATPTPTPTPSIEDVLATAPDISGLTKEIQNEKVVYITASGNEYGMDEGEFAGEYNINISINGTEVGGVALQPSIVDKILANELAIIPEGEPKLKVIIPIDITNVIGEDKLNVFDSVCITVNNTGVIGISSEKPMSLINVVSGDGQFIPSISGASAGLSFFENTTTTDLLTCDSIYPLIAMNDYSMERATDSLFYLVDSNVGFSSETIYDLGQELGLNTSYIKICSGRFAPTSIDTNNLLLMDNGTIVFVFPQ